MKHEMKHFEEYLSEQGLSKRSRDEHVKNLGYFHIWCEESDIPDKAYCNRASILAYVDFMHNKPLNISTQNVRLNSIKKYYSFLKERGIIKRNPAKNLVIRNAGKKVVHHPLGEKALLELFNEYVSYLDAKPHYSHLPQRQQVNLRRKVIASLVIFQGLHTGELKNLLMTDVNIQNSSITIAGGKRSNSRILPLHQRQIIPLYEYVREYIRSDQSDLFSNKVQKGFHTILTELKVINPLVQNLQHIRASVLMNWIKQHGKRKAQYMIGHRYVSTTQSYEIQDTSELSELMERTHLFG